MKITRRELFIKAGLSLIGVGLLGGVLEKTLFSKPIKNQDHPIKGNGYWLWVNIGSQIDYAQKIKSNNEGIGVIGFNPITNEAKKILLPFYGHHLAHDKNSSLAATCEKWGKNLGLLNLQKGEIKAIIQAPKGVRFFGHIQFSFDSNELYASAMDDEKREGVILVYSADDLTLKRIFKSHGKSPHQIILYAPDELMAMNSMTNSLTVLNPQNGELLKTIQLKAPFPAHFSFEKSLNTIILGGRNFPSTPTSFSPIEKKDFEDQYKNVLSVLGFHDAEGDNESLLTLPHSELLSIENTKINNNWFSLVTLPQANKIYLFDLKKREVLTMLDTHFSPRGVSISPEDPSVFFLNSFERELFRGKITGNDKIELTLVKIAEFGNGSHMSLSYI